MLMVAGAISAEAQQSCPEKPAAQQAPAQHCIEDQKHTTGGKTALCDSVETR